MTDKELIAEARDTCAVQTVREMPAPRPRMREEDEALQGDEMSDEKTERERELESLAADMFNWLADYITPEQYAMWEARLEELDIEPTWRWTR